MTENQALYARIGYVEFDRRTVDGESVLVFMRKPLGVSDDGSCERPAAMEGGCGRPNEGFDDFLRRISRLERPGIAACAAGGILRRAAGACSPPCASHR